MEGGGVNPNNISWSLNPRENSTTQESWEWRNEEDLPQLHFSNQFLLDWSQWQAHLEFSGYMYYYINVSFHLSWAHLSWMSFDYCVVQLSVTTANTREDQFAKRGGLFWLTIWRFQAIIKQSYRFQASDEGDEGGGSERQATCGGEKLLPYGQEAREWGESCGHSCL